MAGPPIPMLASGVAMMTWQQPSRRGVAGEAAPRHHADEGHQPAQHAEAGEGLGVEPGDDGHVGVAGPPAAALGEEHDRQPQPLHELEEAVLLLVVHLALGAGEDRVVVRQHGAARPFRLEEVTVDAPDPGDQAVGGRAGHEVLGAAARPLGGDDERAVLLEATGVAQVLDVLARRPPPAGVPALGRLGPPAVAGRLDPGAQLRELGADPVGLRVARGSAATAGSSDSVSARSTSPVCTASPGATATESMRPGVTASTTCSIFMDSSTTSSAPAATRSPGATATRSTVPAKGTRSWVSPATGVRAPRSRRGSPRCCGTRRGAPGAGRRRPRCRWGSRS